MRLKGKSGVVTGAAQGLGKESAKALAAQGASVVVVDRNEAGGKATAAEIAASGGRAVFQLGDVTREQDIIAAIGRCQKEFGAYNFIHQNAGIQIETPLHETTNEQWDLINAVNLRAVFWGSKHSVIAMMKSGGGSIVNTASALSLTADPFLAAYTATKHGVLGLTRSVATDPTYASAGIRCNCICPGDMQTPMIEQYWAATPDPKAAREKMESFYPAKRIGQPREVAQVVVFLVSDESSFVNGSHIIADGGLLAKVY